MDQSKKRRITDFFRRNVDDENSGTETAIESASQTSQSDDATVNSDSVDLSHEKKAKPANFQRKWLVEWPWLKFEEGLGLMKCTYCIDNKMSNTFTTGTNNFRTSTLQRHVESKDHKLSVIAKTQCKGMEKAVSQIFGKQEQAISSAINTVYWLAKENIATEKYPSLLDLLDKLDCQTVKNLNVAQNASYRSHIIAEELQQAISDTIMNDIVQNLKDAICVSILTDESTDISVSGKLIVYAKFVDKNFDVKTHFLGNFSISEKDATSITDVLVKVMVERGVPVEKILCLGSDGASVMTGVHNGVAAQLRRKSPYLLNIHCVAHRLALCTSQAASKLDHLKQYKTVLTNLYYYFKSSSVRSSRLSNLQEVLQQPQIKVREMHDIRWFSFYNTLEGIYKSWDALVTYFDTTELSKDPKATGLKKSIVQYKFAAITWMLMDIIPIVTTLNLVFQKDTLDIAIIQPAVDGAISKLEYFKENDGHYTTEFKRLLADGKGKSLMGHKLENIAQQEQVPSVTITKFIDNLIDNLKTRFPKDSMTIISAMDCLALRDLSFIPSSQLGNYGIEKLDSLLEFYGHAKSDENMKENGPLVDIQSTKSEYDLLKSLIIQQKYPRDKMATLWKIVHDYHSDMFPNLIKLSKVALSIPVQTAICERGFSVQNNIKTAHRNRLAETSLTRLMTINIEGPPLKDFDPASALQEFKTKKQRRIFQKMSM